MLMLKAANIKYEIGERSLLNIKEIKIHEGEKIGLAGKNGVGKSLLIRYLLGDIDGSRNVERYTSCGWMKQLNEGSDATLSGGEKTLAELEDLFAEKQELLFLDEPTNNLDWIRIEELEDQLLRHSGAYVIVSHDRKFLDRTCNKIWELDQGKISIYNGNYTFYEQQKARELKQQYEKHGNYIQEKKRLEKRILQKRAQSKGMRKPPKRMGSSEWQLGKNKAAAHQKKVERVSKTLENRLNHIEKVEKPMEWDHVKMEYPAMHDKPFKGRIVQLGEEAITAGERFLFRTSNQTLKAGSKTALIGENGSGKSTLIGELLRRDDWLRKQNDVGYFHQALEDLPLTSKLYDYVSKGSPLSESTIRIILARLKFFEEDMNKIIAQLSGGERVKASLARLLVSNTSILILDEPTNHLDIEAIQALEQLINDYPGTVLFVTHDRMFIERTADHLWIIEKEEFKEFQGTWIEWQEYVNNPPKAAVDEAYNRMTLETKLTELISRISAPGPKQNLEELNKEYEETLSKLKNMRRG
ncbi:ribosomal protection-like ABC-F family protein [Halobacillus litoralis]|uniref:ribosomal protection-like ABC-F family protein n=1 Tax=Halobacillus litoralis TaxID=45668 RepID=UPI001CFE157F|nr:ATP-binding cassette domain-containing protein [Halobacillus litoralis]